MITLETPSLQMVLHRPDDGFYQGTRFDHSGVFDSLLLQGVELCGRWFPRYDPFLHDTVCGPAEEFTPVYVPAGPPGHLRAGGDEGRADGQIPGSLAVKIGVGLLEVGTEPYDRFRLYPVADPGEWELESTPQRVLFRHRLKGYYTYEKTLAITGEKAFSIGHRLEAYVPLEGEVYNHNFFTLGRLEVTPGRCLDFPFRPEGTWRAAYDSVGFTAGGIRFSRQLKEGESVYTGNIHQAGTEGMPYRLVLREGPLAVHIGGSVPALRTVLWANHRIACPEPYNAFCVRPGAGFRWTLQYEFKNE